ncbi:MAG: VOC family protein [Pseudolysinimonas sp.]|uniref:VOC family protein n=1 Tax=Pseudolysinimonas sp. TaxID=2680009 RepID=UPI00326745D5
MTAILNPYLNFRGTAREAMTFYESVFGGELTMSTFTELGAEVADADKDLIMHAQLEAPGGINLMGADIPSHMDSDARAKFSNFSVSLSGDSGDQLRGYWEKLAVGATITEPLTLAPWGDSFGMLDDRFGVSWLVNISGTPAA